MGLIEKVNSYYNYDCKLKVIDDNFLGAVEIKNLHLQSFRLWIILFVKRSNHIRRTKVKISYNKLWKLLIDKNMKKYQLRQSAAISSNSVAKLGKDEPVSMEVLMKICGALECNIGDICEFVGEDRDD